MAGCYVPNDFFSEIDVTRRMAEGRFGQQGLPQDVIISCDSANPFSFARPFNFLWLRANFS